MTKLLVSEVDLDEVRKLEKIYSDKLEVAEWLNRKLVSNQDNKKMALLNWFGLKEGFSYNLVIKLIEISTPKPSSTFLDPFSGTGTSIFAAANKGLNSIGIELLPFGQFLHDTRKAAFEVNPDLFQIEISKALEYIKTKNRPKQMFMFQHLKITEGAFPEETERDMANYLQYVNEITDPSIKQLMKFACFSVLEKISFTSKDGQYLRWDKRSGRTRAGEYHKREILPFTVAISKALHEIHLTVKGKLFFDNGSKDNFKRISLINGSALENLPKMPQESIDLIISSPPYCNRYDYTRTYALEMAFLGLDNEKLKAYRQQLLSCTVENKSKEKWLYDIYKALGKLETYFDAKKTFEENLALQSILNSLMQCMKEGKLNNKGIYRMVYNYFFEHSFIIHEIARIMKHGGKIYYINDNVQYANISIPVDLILSDFAKSAGLYVNRIYFLRRGKGNSSQQMGRHGREELRKCVYFWEKL